MIWRSFRLFARAAVPAVGRLHPGYFHRKCTKSLPKFFESFSTRA
jgi:hypothetical protein